MSQVENPPSYRGVARSLQRRLWRRVRAMFQPNIDRSGRIARAISGLLFLVAGTACACLTWPEGATLRYALYVVLFGSGLFQLFEAKRGWCVMRACGFRTPM